MYQSARSASSDAHRGREACTNLRSNLQSVTMKPCRRNFFHLASGAVALHAVSRMARAETYPGRCG